MFFIQSYAAVASGIAELHGGKLIVSSTPNAHGSTYLLKLPLGRQCVKISGGARVFATSDHYVDASSASLGMKPKLDSFHQICASNSIFSDFPEEDKRDEEDLGDPFPSMLALEHVGYKHSIRSGNLFGRLSQSMDSSRHAAAGWSRGVRLLVIDDDPVQRNMLCRSLRWLCDVCVDAPGIGLAIGTMKEAAAGGKPFDCVIAHVHANTVRDDVESIKQTGFGGVLLGVVDDRSGGDDATLLFLGAGGSRVLGRPLQIDSIEEILRGFSL